METLHEIKLLRDEAKHRNPDDYAYELGHFVDGALEGVGCREDATCTGGAKANRSEFGLFHNGLLDGPGVIEDSKHGFTIGYFEHGKIVNPEDLQGFEVESMKDIDFEANHHYLVTGVKRYTKKTEDGTIEMVFGTFSHIRQYFMSGPKIEPLNYPFPYAHLTLKDGDEEIFSIATRVNNMGTSFVGIKTKDGFCTRSTPYDVRVCSFRKYHFEDVRVRQGTETIDKVIYKGYYSVRLFLPRSVKRIIPDAISEADHFLRFVEVFYDGTKEEWEKIIKDDTITETTEDWYGYYYHNSERYETHTVHSVFPKMCKILAVHCADGDIEGE